MSFKNYIQYCYDKALLENKGKEISLKEYKDGR